MALDYTTDVLPHLVEGDLAATRNAINANMRHVRAADITGLRKLIVGSGMVHSLGFGGASGIISEAYPTLSAANKMLADAFLNDLITNAPYPADTHDGGRVLNGIVGLATANEAKLRNGYTAASFSEAGAALTGGRKYGSVTNQQILDAIESHEAQVVREALITEYESLMGVNVMPADQTRAEIVTGLRAVADALEAGA
jgi:hypothetical protein